MDSSSEILGGHRELSSEAALKHARRRNEAAFRLAEAFQRRPLPPGRKPAIIETHREWVPPQALWERGRPPTIAALRGGVPPQVLWKRSGQHEPRRGARSRGAPQRSRPPTIAALRGGVPPQALWKRSGQHEPRKAPRPGAPLTGVVLQKARSPTEAVLQNAHPRNEAVFPGILR